MPSTPIEVDVLVWLSADKYMLTTLKHQTFLNQANRILSDRTDIRALRQALTLDVAFTDLGIRIKVCYQSHQAPLTAYSAGSYFSSLLVCGGSSSCIHSFIRLAQSAWIKNFHRWPESSLKQVMRVGNRRSTNPAKASTSSSTSSTAL